MAKKRRRAKTRTAPTSARQPKRDWPRLAGEAALMLTILAVPLVISPGSKDPLDVKDVALALGVSLGLCLVVVTSLARGHISWISSRLNVFVIAFLAWATLTVIYSQYRHATLSEVGRFAGNVGVYWLVILCVRDAGQVRRLLAIAAVAALAVAVYAFAQKCGSDFVLALISEGDSSQWKWDTQTGRVFSFLGNATYLASYTVLVAPLLVAAAWPTANGGHGDSTVPSWYSRVFSVTLFLVAGMLLLTLYFTVSLSPMIGLAFGLLVALVLVFVRAGGRALRGAIRWLLLLALLLGTAGLIGYRYLPPTQQSRVQSVLRLKDPVGRGRVVQWLTAYELFRERPLLGRGYGTFSVHSLERMAPVWYADLGKSAEKMFVPNYAHNEYLQVLSGTGLVGGLLFVALLAVSFRTAVYVALRHPDRQWRRLGLAVTAAMTAYLFQNFFGITVRVPGAVTFFWLALGLVAVPAACMPSAGGETLDGPRTRDLRFRQISRPALAGSAVGLLAVVAILCWLTVRPAKANVMVKRAELLAKLGKYAAAAELADQAARLNPWDLRAYYTSAYSWGNLGDHEKAVESNKKALDLLPGNASVYYNLGVSYRTLGRLAEARQSFERAIELMPTSARHHAGLAEVLLAQQEYDAALEHADEAIRLTQEDSEPYALAADVEARRGNLDGSADYLRRAIEVAPREARLWKELVKILLRAGEEEKALPACREWLKLDPGSSDAHVTLVQILIRQNELDQALRQLREAIGSGKGDARLHLLASEVESKRGNLEQAEQHLRQGTKRFPKDVQLWRSLAQNLMRQRKPREAISAAREWLKLEPDSSDAHDVIGTVSYNVGDYRGARENLGRAVELDPESHNARLKLAYTHLRLGQTAQARQQFEYLARNAPGTREGREAKRRLDGMR